MEEIDDLEDSIKISANELLAFQRELKQEKELLQKILTKIDDQVHRLQVNMIFKIVFFICFNIKTILYII